MGYLSELHKRRSENFAYRAMFFAGCTALVCVGESQASHAGEFTRIAQTAGQYKFTECQEPETPDITLNSKLRGNAAVRDYNAQVSTYNQYIAKVQTYMACMSEEADRDLEVYYQAVNASLVARQDAMESKSAALRKILANGPRKGAPIADKKQLTTKDGRTVPSLEGAEEGANEGEGASPSND